MRLFTCANNSTRQSVCIDPLRCKSAESGFRNVYRAKKNRAGAWIFVAKVKVAGCLMTVPGSRSPEPWRCAEHVARWYLEHYGPQWPEVLAARKNTPWVIEPVGDWYKAAVWVEGVREYVMRTEKQRRNRWRVTGRVEVFPTKAAARTGIEVYLSRAYGLFGRHLLYRRAASKFPKPGRQLAA